MLASSNPVEAQPIATQGKGNEILRNARPSLDLHLAQEALYRCATREDPTTMAPFTLPKHPQIRQDGKRHSAPARGHINCFTLYLFDPYRGETPSYNAFRNYL